jgi:hypothetical protein
MAFIRLALAAHVLGLTGCDFRDWVCEAPDRSRIELLPTRLSETGLFRDPQNDVLAADVVPFAPEFELWSDGADKRRWVYLPPSSVIDTADMDSWSFPEGTKFWKEFTAGGVRVETRLLAKLGPSDGDWVALAYVWNEDQSDAIAAPYGFRDASGTTHDVPGAGECEACHGGRASRVLGFSAIQLSQAEPLGLDDLGREGRLSHRAPPIAVPGDDTERAALGYLHANCSHCHNSSRPSREGARCFDPENDLDFGLRTDALGAVADTATYRTVVDTAIERGDPEGSTVVGLMSARAFWSQMPPLATERVDDEALALVRRWIEEMR